MTIASHPTTTLCSWDMECQRLEVARRDHCHFLAVRGPILTKIGNLFIQGENYSGKQKIEKVCMSGNLSVSTVSSAGHMERTR